VRLPTCQFTSTTANIPNINTANDAVVSEKGTVEQTDNKHGNEMPEPVPVTTIHDEKRTEFATDINHVTQLGLMNTAELEKKVVRRLDTWMLPQLRILYMFNYLNRTNIAQARLNTFSKVQVFVEGDYQVCGYGGSKS
jgi:hypothetical protein